MVEIARLIEAAGFGARLVDRQLRWGAKASAYRDDIAQALEAGETPVLVELADDLGPEIDRSRLVTIDHHGERAGADRPSSLRQIFDLLRGAGAAVVWTRWHDLAEANDIGHAKAMRRMGATAAEIRAVRDADRAAQGIGPEVERLSLRDARASRLRGRLRLVETDLPTSSAIMDFLLPEYGGPAEGAGDTLVIMPQAISFFGRGPVIAALKDRPGCWYGGSLPEEGFWGMPRDAGTDVAGLIDQVAALAGGQEASA